MGEANECLALSSGSRHMAGTIDEAQVRKVAKLARLELSEQEIVEFTGQLSAILGYMEKMDELGTDAVEPLAHSLPVSNVFREDHPVESIGPQAALANAPESDEQFFLVPKILDDGSGA